MIKSRFSKLSVLLVYFLDFFGITVVFPIFASIILMGHHGFFTDSLPWSSKLFYLALLIAAFPFSQMFGAPLFGEIADMKGRKRAFHFTLIGEAIGYFLTALSLLTTNYVFVLIGRLISGFFAGNLTVCLASIADVSVDPKSRSQNFGYLTMAAGLSFICAIIVGGTFSDQNLDPQFRPDIPFWILTALALGILLLVKLFYKETGKKKSYKKLEFIKQSFSLIKNRQIRPIYAVFFFLMLGWIPSLQFLSASLLIEFGASKQMILYTFLGAGLLWSFTNGYVNGLLSEGFKPQNIALVSLFITSIAFFFNSVISNLYLFILFFEVAVIFTSLAWTNCLALVSLQANIENQGYILGWNQALGALAMVIAPFICALVGNHGIRNIYLFISASFFISFILIFWKTTKLKQAN